MQNAPEFFATDRAAWRQWLVAHHASSQSVWVVYVKTSAGGQLRYEDIVEEALCFGWIDSVGGKVDAERTKLYVSRRKPHSGWSKPNKERVTRLTELGLIAPAGQAVIDAAKASGAWDKLDDSEALIMPPDLQAALEQNAVAANYFDGFPPSTKKAIYQWITQAKQAATRQNRIQQTVELAAQNKRANQWLPKDQ